MLIIFMKTSSYIFEACYVIEIIIVDIFVFKIQFLITSLIVFLLLFKAILLE